MINVYEKENYRELIQDILEEAKQMPTNLSHAQIAKTCGIQPSYLTNVIKLRCHFNSDQASEILTYLGYGNEDIDYVLLLIELERTGSSKRREVLREKVKNLRQTKIRADNYVDAKLQKDEELKSLMAYYLDPLLPILHMYFGLRKAEQSPPKIAEKFRVTEARITGLIDYLRRKRFIELKNGKFHLTSVKFHLPKDSPLSKPHQLLMRGLAQEHLARVSLEQHFAFSVTFNADENARAKIEVEFLKFIKKCQNLSQEAKSDNVMQMNFDLFPWEP